MFLHPLLAQTDDVEALPDSLDEVKESLFGTLGQAWTDFVSHIPYLAAGILVVLLTWIVAAIGTSVVGRVLKKQSMRNSLRELFMRFVTIGIWAGGLLLAAMIIFPGLTPAKALGALGLLSVAVGFAFKDIFENFFAGILMLLRFPFENGDFIECEGITGKVEHVEARMTQIRKTTGELVVVPNSVLFKNAVEVITSTPTRRVHITAGVGYGEDVESSRKVIEEAVRACDSVDGDSPVEICAKEFGASSIDFDVAWWTDSKPASVRHSISEVITRIKEALDREDIEIPFPYQTMTFSEPLKINSLQE